ncbi:type II toxin-antitoxin system PemK/MazF family toxin [Pseudarthrobacter oxydans]|uniref:type II toxin-antitoxin system PemK/MazF family toxin n=1 Tax=Pseudarthrobacter oxydans TaxID=1671 RepID=UPI001573422D|nr:type II toxin-antitoxin system PemK/MazF family toxin [Pseudarthrobacter oxydans]
MVRSGSVALLWFPFGPDQTAPFKKRPVLVIHKSGSGPEQCVVCVMITGSEQRLANPHPTDLSIPEWSAVGLAKESVVRTNRFWGAEESHVERVLGQAPPEFTAEVRGMVAKAIGVRD